MSKSNKSLSFFTIAFCVSLMTVFLGCADKSLSSAKGALTICYQSVIPSLFPFMVLSSLISKAVVPLISKKSLRFIALLPYSLGALCGFPIGASTVTILYKNGIIEKTKAEYMCALCNVTGPAFIIGVIGKHFWGNVRIGVIFYVCQIISSVIVYTLEVSIFSNRIKADSILYAPDYYHQETQKSTFAENSFPSLFCSSVNESAISVISVCGYIVFFKTLIDCVGNFIRNRTFFAIFGAILEFTTGAANAAELGGTVGIAICGFSIGFSGLSVMAQSAVFLFRSGLSALPLFVMKIFVGIFTALLSSIAYNFLNLSEKVFSEYVVYYPIFYLNFACAFLIGFYFIIHIINIGKNY